MPNACPGLADRWATPPYLEAMTTPQPTKLSGWFSGRTRLVTVLSIVAVGFAGATAVSANMGLLDAASNANVDTLSATGDLTTPSNQVIDVYLPDPTSTIPSTTPSTIAASPAVSAGIQEFTVDTAGTVAVASTANGLRLESVTPATGWTWSLTQTSQTELMVTMTDGGRTLEFVATAMPDGNITASVDEPIVTPAPAPAQAAVNTGGYGEHEGGEDDD